MDVFEKVQDELMSWPGVTSGLHRFGGTEFHVNKREMGHMHGSSWADLPFPMSIRHELVSAGKVQPHHVLPKSGHVLHREGARRRCPHQPVQNAVRQAGKKSELKAATRHHHHRLPHRRLQIRLRSHLRHHLQTFPPITEWTLIISILPQSSGSGRHHYARTYTNAAAPHLAAIDVRHHVGVGLHRMEAFLAQLAVHG